MLAGLKSLLRWYRRRAPLTKILIALVFIATILSCSGVLLPSGPPARPPATPTRTTERPDELRTSSLSVGAGFSPADFPRDAAQSLYTQSLYSSPNEV